MALFIDNNRALNVRSDVHYVYDSIKTRQFQIKQHQCNTTELWITEQNFQTLVITRAKFVEMLHAIT